MRIAMVAPLYESVPPQFYGGTERVVSFLTDRLVEENHHVTLFATADSSTKAELSIIGPKALRLNSHCVDPTAWHVLMLERVCKRARDFDIIHFHTDYLHFPLARRLETPHVTTVHGRLDLPDYLPLYREFSEIPLISISRSQRTPLPKSRWVGNIYHGLPKHQLAFSEKGGDYLAFLGRISPEKGIEDAIAIASMTGMRLIIAAKIGAADRAYYLEKVRPLLANPQVEFIGEIAEHEKQAFLGSAKALLFPIAWPEPFGLVMIEALACGTPVIAFPSGSVREIIEHGQTGFVVPNVEAAVQALGDINSLSRRRCRKSFEERFVVEPMARNYLSVYQSLAFGHRASDRFPEVI